MMEKAFAIMGYGYLIIQEATLGYDYSFLDKTFHLIDGGIYDDDSLSIDDVSNLLIADLEQELKKDLVIKTVNYEKVSAAYEETEEIPSSNNMIEKFRCLNEIFFHNITGAGCAEIEKITSEFIQAQIAAYGINAEIKNVILYGSRARGLEHTTSDIDILLEYKADGISEDYLFNVLHENPLSFNGIAVDINPIQSEKSGSMEEYLPYAESYLHDKLFA